MNYAAQLGLGWLTGGLSGLGSKYFSDEAQYSRRRKKGKVQSSDNIGSSSSMPEYIQNMILTGRDENGNISSNAAARGAGFTNKEIATEFADWAKMQESRAYEQSVWEERESLQGQVRQAQEAGINPAALVGGMSAGSGNPVSSDSTGVDSSSSFDEFGGAFNVLSTLLNIGGTASDIIMKGKSVANDTAATKADIANTTSRTNAEVANINADTNLKNEQTAGQRNLNLSFWQKFESDMADAVTNRAAKKAGIDKIEFDKDMAEKLYALEERNTAVREFEAANGRMLIMSQMQLIASQIELNASETANTEASTDKIKTDKDYVLKMSQMLDEQLKGEKFENAKNELSKIYGVPPDLAFIVKGVQTKMGEYSFSRWLSGLQKTLAEKGAVYTYIRETTTSLGFGPATNGETETKTAETNKPSVVQRIL